MAKCDCGNLHAHLSHDCPLLKLPAASNTRPCECGYPHFNIQHVCLVKQPMASVPCRKCGYQHGHMTHDCKNFPKRKTKEELAAEELRRVALEAEEQNKVPSPGLVLSLARRVNPLVGTVVKRAAEPDTLAESES